MCGYVTGQAASDEPETGQSESKTWPALPTPMARLLLDSAGPAGPDSGITQPARPARIHSAAAQPEPQPWRRAGPRQPTARQPRRLGHGWTRTRMAVSRAPGGFRLRSFKQSPGNSLKSRGFCGDSDSDGLGLGRPDPGPRGARARDGAGPKKRPKKGAAQAGGSTRFGGGGRGTRARAAVRALNREADRLG